MQMIVSQTILPFKTV